MATIKSTDDTFKKIIKENKLVLIDFWAPWCTPCLRLSPILEEIDKELEDKILFVKHNIDEEPNIPTAEGVRGIPTMQIYKDSVLVDTIVGLTTKSDLTNKIKTHLPNIPDLAKSKGV
tara:strand:+ start:238 stop:591 length:354 start_codon:yes stop_codon:yes gene_type:complete